MSSSLSGGRYEGGSKLGANGILEQVSNQQYIFWTKEFKQLLGTCSSPSQLQVEDCALTTTQKKGWTLQVLYLVLSVLIIRSLNFSWNSPLFKGHIFSGICTVCMPKLLELVTQYLSHCCCTIIVSKACGYNSLTGLLTHCTCPSITVQCVLVHVAAVLPWVSAEVLQSNCVATW